MLSEYCCQPEGTKGVSCGRWPAVEDVHLVNVNTGGSPLLHDFSDHTITGISILISYCALSIVCVLLLTII